MEFRELRAFVAVAEAGGFSAAARRLHLSQPALSQTVNGLERELGVRLVDRSSNGVRVTEAGAELLRRGRAMLADHDAAVAALTGGEGIGAGIIRLGVPLELPPELLAAALARLTEGYASTSVQVRHASSAAQLSSLSRGELDLGLVRQRPAGYELDATVVLREPLGVLVSEDRASALRAAGGGIALEDLDGLSWLSFPRDDSPVWYDEVAAILRSHGLEPRSGGEHLLIAEVKFAAVAGGTAYALAPPSWSRPLPAGVAWCPLAGDPLVRRTWAVWPASSTRRDLGALVAALEDVAAVPGS